MSDSDLRAASIVSLPPDAPDPSKPPLQRKRKSIQASIQESLKMRQARAKAARVSQRARLDGRHQYMFDLLADKLKIDASTVAEYMLDGNQVKRNFSTSSFEAVSFFFPCSWTCLMTCLLSMGARESCFITKKQMHLYHVSCTINNK